MIKESELFNFLIKKLVLNEEDRKKTIKDILKLQKKLTPIGIVKDENDLLVLSDRSLVMVLMWQHELFAIKHFHEISQPFKNDKYLDFL